MTWTPVQTAQNKTVTTATTASASFGSTVGFGHIVCGYFLYTPTTTSIVTSVKDDQLNNYSVVDFIGNSGGGFSLGSFWSNGPLSNAPQTVTITITTSGTNLWIGIDEFSFAPSTAFALDGHNIAANASSVSTLGSGNFTPLVNGDLIYTGCASSGVNTAPSGFTLLQTSGNFNSAWEVLTSATTINPTWTFISSIPAVFGFGISAVPSSNLMFAQILT